MNWSCRRWSWSVRLSSDGGIPARTSFRTAAACARTASNTVSAMVLVLPAVRLMSAKSALRDPWLCSRAARWIATESPCSFCASCSYAFTALSLTTPTFCSVATPGSEISTEVFSSFSSDAISWARLFAASSLAEWMSLANHHAVTGARTMTATAATIRGWVLIHARAALGSNLPPAPSEPPPSAEPPRFPSLEIESRTFWIESVSALIRSLLQSRRRTADPPPRGRRE